jgi:RNA polymerase sigma-70 factor, ECF subfamily
VTVLLAEEADLWVPRASRAAVASLASGTVSAAANEEMALIERLRSGDEAAFAHLVRTHQPAMLRLARGFVPSQAVAEDVVQDTWLGVVRGIDRFEGRSSLATWLFTILVNRAKTAGVREQRHRGPRDDSDVADLADSFDAGGGWARPPDAWAEEAEDRIVAEQLAARARAFLDELPPAQREVVLLRDVEGLGSHEACQVLGISEGNQRVLLHRGRTRVRNALAAEMGRR